MASREGERVALVTGAMHGAGNLVMRRMRVAEAKTELSRLKRVAALCKRLLEGWIGKHRGVLSAPDRALLNHAATQVRDLLRDGALTSLDTPEGTVPLTDIGWYDDQFVYLTGPTIAGIAQAADAGLDRLFDLLEGQDLLKPGGERGYQYKLPSRVPGRPRAYRLSRDILRFAPVG